MNLVEGLDYYLEGELMVFTAAYLLRRGRCCESHCRHCPYGLAPKPAKPSPADESCQENPADRAARFERP